ncbi:MAG TPA: winged helix-turn-helix domain-containing protein [Cellvibrio sp.]|nr:winged helix-turn-helix domain-containing protein [Cellvibrio sp.]
MTFSFGDIVVNPETHSIHVAGREKRLEPKLIALLSYLAENAQQVITRQQIIEAVWPNVVVVEESVTQAIFALRNALRDDAKNPKYIETIPKKGYRFLADVTFTRLTSAEPANLAAPSRLYPLTMIAVLGLAVAAGILWLTIKQGSQYEIVNILPSTQMPGAECCMAINSRREMVFINVLGSDKNLYVKDLRSGTQQRITQDDWQKGLPLWLDDTTLIYPRCSNSECQIVRQNLHNSPQVIYTTSHYIGEITLAQGNPNLLVFNDEYETSELVSFDLRSGSHEKLRNSYPELPPYIFHPILSADASQLYFVNLNPKPVLMSLNLATKAITTLSDQFDEINSFNLDKRQQFIIAGIHNSTVGLWLLAKAQAQPKIILRASGDEKLQFPLLDPLEKTLYYQSVQLDQNIAMASSTQPADDNFPELNSTGVDSLATLSSDGQFIYFISNRTGFSEVWRYDLNTRQTKPITRMKLAAIHSILVANDGQRFSATYIEHSQPHLGIFSVHNGELLASIQAYTQPLNWSQDDRYLYAKTDVDKKPVLMRYDSQTLATTIIQANAGLAVQESADRDSLIFFDHQNNMLLERNLTSGEEQKLLAMQTKPSDQNGLWTGLMRIDSSRTSVFVIKQNKDLHQLWQYPFRGADLTPRKLLDLPTNSWVTYISPDGTKVLYDKAMPPTGSIMKINFQ